MSLKCFHLPANSCRVLEGEVEEIVEAEEMVQVEAKETAINQNGDRHIGDTIVRKTTYRKKNGIPTTTVTQNWVTGLRSSKKWKAYSMGMDLRVGYRARRISHFKYMLTKCTGSITLPVVQERIPMLEDERRASLMNQVFLVPVKTPT